MAEPRSIDQIIDRLIDICQTENDIADLSVSESALQALHSRLSGGELHIAIIGQFNRGKSTFINRLLDFELLPVSVLPLTAIPTEIRYGAKPRLEIDCSGSVKEFLGEADISNALIQYVTEEHNPENRLLVKSVKLFAPSELLQHGTTFIDTPGFGSTHIHNTKATLQTLKDCDAALFMLSADLPITQMELNFIKQIVPHVSRLFFIYNKRDLLSPEELEMTSQFIRKTIETQIKISTEDRFFPVSAKRAMISRNGSGLEIIEKEVLTFLQREKYFSLAEAIQTKLSSITGELKSTFYSKLKKLDDQTSELTKDISDLQDREEKAIQLLSQLRSEQKREIYHFPETQQFLSKIELQFSSKISALPKITTEAIQPLTQTLLLELAEGATKLFVSEVQKEFKYFSELNFFTENLSPQVILSTSQLMNAIKFTPIKLKTGFFSSRKKIEHELIHFINDHHELNTESLRSILSSELQRVRFEFLNTELQKTEDNLESIQKQISEVKNEISEVIEKNKIKRDKFVSINEELKTMVS